MTSSRVGSSLGRCGVLLGVLAAFACGDARTPSAANTDATPPPAKREGVVAKEAPPPAPEPPRREAPPVRKDGTIFAESALMGTHFSINVWLGSERTPAEAGLAIQAAFDEIARIEHVTSEWMADSELSRFNDAAGGPPMKLSPDLFAVLLRSREISEATDGRFDVTFYGVGQLWKFEPGAKPPADAEIQAKRALVDWRRIELDAGTRSGRLATAGMKVGLGAIAKGYAVDRASALLVARGFADHVVEGGGDTYASGNKGGKPWMVGVQNPHEGGVVGALPSTDIAVVTSGDYERFFEYEGRRYAHILDPTTGYPLESAKSFQSITVVGPNAMDADAFATAVAVMGPEGGMAFIESQPQLEAVLITRDDRVLVSSGLAHRYIPAPPGDARATSPAPLQGPTASRRGAASDPAATPK
ncbi:MAG: FAD:protein FMN transferase [Deltaproteobacteria bacterium]|nr:FAD:protein FMN transferase [Deltaproteobacteria bacterium]MBP7287121.1 FAD:protein FMN transferase [Nannocystaceae bacterium]